MGSTKEIFWSKLTKIPPLIDSFIISYVYILYIHVYIVFAKIMGIQLNTIELNEACPCLSRSQSRKLEVLEHNVGVLENDCKLLKSSRDKAMDKVISTGRLLMKKPNFVVPKDIVTDVLSTSGLDARVPLVILDQHSPLRMALPDLVSVW
jgi:hypothetical protein